MSHALSQNSDGNALLALRNAVAEDLDRIDQMLTARAASSVKLIPEIADHILSAGGKRLRPMLTLGCAKLCNYQGEHHIQLAASVECMHTATLLHDDVVDSSALRRGLATANHVWGNKESILVGDFLLGQAFQLMVKPNSIRALDILSSAAVVISEGEVLQLFWQKNTPDFSEETYLQIIASKTAELFAAACQISGIISEQPEEKIEALQKFGHALGMAFQITDDVLDYTADEKTLGKNIGDDFKEGKVTLPVILSYQKGTEAEKTFWKNIFKHPESADLAKAKTLLTHHNALTDALQYAEKYAEKAKAALTLFPHSSIKEILLQIAGYSVLREL